MDEEESKQRLGGAPGDTATTAASDIPAEPKEMSETSQDQTASEKSQIQLLREALAASCQAIASMDRRIRLLEGGDGPSSSTTTSSTTGGQAEEGTVPASAEIVELNARLAELNAQAEADRLEDEREQAEREAETPLEEARRLVEEDGSVEMNHPESGDALLEHYSGYLTEGNLAALKYLLANGAKPNRIMRWTGSTVLTRWCTRVNYDTPNALAVEGAQALMQLGVDVNNRYDDCDSWSLETTCRQEACRRGHLGLLKALIEGGADLGEPYHGPEFSRSTSPLHIILDQHNSDLSERAAAADAGAFKLLIQSGADPTLRFARDSKEVAESPIVVAAELATENPRFLDAILRFSQQRRAGQRDAADTAEQKEADAPAASASRAIRAWPKAKQEFRRALYRACSKTGSAAAVRMLVGAGVDKNWTRPEDGATLLCIASKRGHSGAVRALVEAGAYKDVARDYDDATALILAARYNHVEVVKILVEAGANVHLACTRSDRQDGEADLSEREPGADSAYSSFSDRLKRRLEKRPQLVLPGTALFLAAYYGHTEAVGLLLDAGADPAYAQPSGGQTGLYCASSQGHAPVIVKLLEAGVDKNALCRFNADYGDVTALHAAIAERHDDCVAALIDSGADWSIPSTERAARPIHFAAIFGCKEAVRLLLAAGEDPNRPVEIEVLMSGWGQQQPQRFEIIPLTVAVFQMEQRGLQRAYTIEPNTATDQAFTNDYLDIVRTLGAGGATHVNEAPSDQPGRTLLFRACMHESPQMIKALLDAGADMRAPSVGFRAEGVASVEGGVMIEPGWLPIHLASMLGNSQVVKLLLDAGQDPDAVHDVFDHYAYDSEPCRLVPTTPLAHVLSERGAGFNKSGNAHNGSIWDNFMGLWYGGNEQSLERPSDAGRDSDYKLITVLLLRAGAQIKNLVWANANEGLDRIGLPPATIIPAMAYYAGAILPPEVDAGRNACSTLAVLTRNTKVRLSSLEAAAMVYPRNMRAWWTFLVGCCSAKERRDFLNPAYDRPRNRLPGFHGNAGVLSRVWGFLYKPAWLNLVGRPDQTTASAVQMMQFLHAHLPGNYREQQSPLGEIWVGGRNTGHQLLSLLARCARTQRGFDVNLIPTLGEDLNMAHREDEGELYRQGWGF